MTWKLKSNPVNTKRPCLFLCISVYWIKHSNLTFKAYNFNVCHPIGKFFPSSIFSKQKIIFECPWSLCHRSHRWVCQEITVKISWLLFFWQISRMLQLLAALEGSNSLSLSNLFTLKKLDGVESMKKMSN